MNNRHLHIITDSLLKALILDVAVTTGISLLLKNNNFNADTILNIYAGAYTSYVVRNIARDSFGHPWVGGILGGAIKYAVKDSSAGLGAFNNFAYEVTKDFPILGNDLDTLAIEGTEQALSSSYKQFISSNDTITNITIGAVTALAAGSVIGLILIGAANALYLPLLAYATAKPPSTSIVIGVSLTLLAHSFVKVNTIIGNKLGPYLDNNDSLLNTTVSEEVNDHILHNQTPDNTIYAEGL
jgi:hypothetical protein